MNRRSLLASGAALLALAVGCAPSTAVGGGGAVLDRAVMPGAGANPSYDFPEVERFTLSNGLPVWFVRRSDLPLITLQLLLNAGGIAEPDGSAGLASLTAAMLTQGTTRRTATQIADETAYLATTLTAGSGRESAVVTLGTLSRNLEPSLEIFSDVVANPAFDEAEWTRIRDQRIAAILQSRDQPATVVSEEFARRIYGAVHPYGRPLQGTRESVGSISVAALRDFHQAFYRPGNADLIVVGDVSRTELTTLLERHLGGWAAGPTPAAVVPEIPSPQAATRVFLIDRPGAAQSEIRIGHLGIERAHRDFFPILVLNAILGGQFSSRINLNLREDKGYTYGASSAFQTGRFPGPFLAGGGVQTAVTAESVVEFMRELQEVRGTRPVTVEELEFAKTGIIRGEPLTLETNSQIAGRLQQLILFDLPLDYFDRYNENIAAVTLADVNRVAREYLHPDRFAVVIVGDRASIEQGLRTLPYPIEFVVLDG